MERGDILLEDNVFISVAKITQDGSRIYAVDLYCNNIYMIDLNLGVVEIIGEFSGEEEQIYTIFDIHICDKKLVMLPRNGKYIHVFDLETKKDLIYDIREDISCIDDVYNCFSLCYEKKIYMFNRSNGLVLEYDYLNNQTQRIVTNESYERLQITNRFLVGDSMYMHCCLQNKIIVYSVKNNRILDILLPDELRGVINVYIIDQYIIAYHDSSRYVYFLNDRGEIVKKYNTAFKENQIAPFVWKSGEDIYIFGNRNGEVCKINIENNSVKTQIISELNNIDVAYIGEYDEHIYCFQMTKSYQRTLNKCIKIDRKTLKVTISGMEFNTLSFSKETNFKYNQNISRHLLQNVVHSESNAINLQRFLKCGSKKRSIHDSDYHGCGYEIIRRIMN